MFVLVFGCTASYILTGPYSYHQPEANCASCASYAREGSFAFPVILSWPMPAPTQFVHTPLPAVLLG